MIRGEAARAAWLASVGEFLKRARAAKGYSQLLTSELAGLSQGGYSRVEKGKADISAWRLQCLLDVLGYELAIVAKETPPRG